MKKLVTLLILIAAAGGGAYYYYAFGKTAEKPTVIPATISQNDITEVVSATGTLEAQRRVDVGSQVSGVVQSLNVDFNSIVTKDMVLAQIDPSLLEVQVAIRKATIDRQRSDIENQRVQLEDTEKQLERTKTMFDKGLSNQQAYDAAVLAVKNRKAQINSAEKSLIQAQADLANAELNVSYTTIKSPIDGVVVDRRVDVGQTVQASMSAPSFFILATDLRTLKLTAGVDEAEIGKIQPGMPVTFLVDAYPQQTFRGTVDSVRLNATATNNVVTYPVWITAENPELKLRPSMTAQVRIIIATAPNAIRIPSQALRFRPNTDIYNALGITPPQTGRGMQLAANGENGGGGRTPGGRGGREGGQAQGPEQPRTGNAPAQTPPGTAQAPTGGGRDGAPRMQGGDQGGRGGNRQPGGGGQPGAGGGRGAGGRGFGGQSGSFANLSPEERERMRAQFAAGGGGRGGGGRRGGAGPDAGPQQSASDRPALSGGGKIDEQFTAPPRRINRGSVWIWDEPTKKLTEVQVSTGLSDGQFAELIQPSELKVGQQLVTNVVLPVTRTQQNNSNLFNPQGGRGFGGPQPGGGPGGGGPGGGGGGRGGGGGGGGRGGN